MRSGDPVKSLNRERPNMRSRITSSVHLSPKISSEQATGHGERRLERAIFSCFAERGREAIGGRLPEYPLAIHKYFCLSFASDMKDAAAAQVARLAPPGAGLPWLELQAARFLFWRLRRRMNRAQLDSYFEKERDLMLGMARSCSPKVGRKRRLIKRLRGIEDSSRFWSVYMTLDHVRIVNTGAARVIQTLGREEVPTGKANTASVKPSPEADASAIEGFNHSCELFLKCARALPDLHTKERFAHPWFGMMDAAGWHAMGAMHINLHRRQIERILAAKE
jgi:hypothetical protein